MKRAIWTFTFLWLLSALGFGQARLICQLSPGVDPAFVAARYQIILKDRTDGAPFALFEASNIDVAHAVQQAMLSDIDVVWAEDDQGMTTPETEKAKTVPQKGSTLPAVGDRIALYAANKNMLIQINWNQATANLPGRNVRIAILDTGLSPYQPYLWEKVDASMNAIDANLPAYDLPKFVNQSRNGPNDQLTGHGTMVAGIIDQISPKSRFVIARVANSDGLASAWTVVKGLAFAVVQGAEVANVSLGSLNRIPAMTDVMEWCETNNLLVVAAIGNNGLEAACYPATVKKVVCTGGLNPNNTKAGFSNWERECDVSAPATGIISQNWNGTLGNWSGTSFSTPMAAATAIEALRLTRPLAPSVLRNLFDTSGRDLDALNPDYQRKLGKLLDFSAYIAAANGFRPRR